MVWRGEAIAGASLPEATDDSLRRRFPEAEAAAPPIFVQAVIDGIRSLLEGERISFGDVELELSEIETFERQVYAATLAIPAGEVRTYGEIAEAIGAPGAARAVGRALGRNPIPIVIPCHRVVAAAGGKGGFSAPGGTDTKFTILAIEGARRSGAPELFDALPMAVKPARA